MIKYHLILFETFYDSKLLINGLLNIIAVMIQNIDQYKKQAAEILEMLFLYMKLFENKLLCETLVNIKKKQKTKLTDA